MKFKNWCLLLALVASSSQSNFPEWNEVSKFYVGGDIAGRCATLVLSKEQKIKEALMEELRKEYYTFLPLFGPSDRHYTLLEKHLSLSLPSLLTFACSMTSERSVEFVNDVVKWNSPNYSFLEALMKGEWIGEMGEVVGDWLEGEEGERKEIGEMNEVEVMTAFENNLMKRGENLMLMSEGEIGGEEERREEDAGEDVVVVEGEEGDEIVDELTLSDEPLEKKGLRNETADQTMILGGLRDGEEKGKRGEEGGEVKIGEKDFDVAMRRIFLEMDHKTPQNFYVKRESRFIKVLSMPQNLLRNQVSAIVANYSVAVFENLMNREFEEFTKTQARKIESLYKRLVERFRSEFFFDDFFESPNYQSLMRTLAINNDFINYSPNLKQLPATHNLMYNLFSMHQILLQSWFQKLHQQLASLENLILIILSESQIPEHQILRTHISPLLIKFISPLFLTPFPATETLQIRNLELLYRSYQMTESWENERGMNREDFFDGQEDFDAELRELSEKRFVDLRRKIFEERINHLVKHLPHRHIKLGNILEGTKITLVQVVKGSVAWGGMGDEERMERRTALMKRLMAHHDGFMKLLTRVIHSLPYARGERVAGVESFEIQMI